MNLLKKNQFLGKDEDGNEVNLRLKGSRILLLGSSGCGKSTFTAAIVGELIRNKCQFCLIDQRGTIRLLMKQ